MDFYSQFQMRSANLEQLDIVYRETSSCLSNKSTHAPNLPAITSITLIQTIYFSKPPIEIYLCAQCIYVHVIFSFLKTHTYELMFKTISPILNSNI